MAISTVDIAAAARRPSLRTRIGELLDREEWLGPIFVSPALILLLLLVAYPFCMALYFSVSNAFIGLSSHLICLRKFIYLWQNVTFWPSFLKEFGFCRAAVGAKLVLGV